MEYTKELVILLAEDDEGHADLIREGLQASGGCKNIIHFTNGLDVWNFVSRQGNGAVRNINKNYIVLLDLNMPILDGIETLKKIKSDEALKVIPVMMLSTNDDPQEVATCYKNGCNMYITKPVNYTKFTETLDQLSKFIQIISF